MIRRLVIIGLLTALGAAAQSVAAEPSREKWQRVDDLIGAAKIGAGSKVADVGAGDGFLTLRLAPLVGETGKVFAVDISDTKLSSLKQRVAEKNLGNVEVVKGDADDPHLSVGDLDAVIILNSYHEMPKYAEVLRHIREALKPGGRLVIAEPGPTPAEETRAQQIAKHHIAAQYVAEEVAQAGFKIVEQQEKFAQIPGLVWYSLVVGQRPAE
jgi:ubiquinone/menaquinone biosynthesis C-methylase UbiE